MDRLIALVGLHATIAARAVLGTRSRLALLLVALPGLAALSLGVLVGDGFLSAQSEKVDDLEDIGRAVLKHAKALAAGHGGVAEAAAGEAVRRRLRP